MKCYTLYIKVNKNIIGVIRDESRMMKREVGENPARTRRCNVGVLLQYVTGVIREDEAKC